MLCATRSIPVIVTKREVAKRFISIFEESSAGNSQPRDRAPRWCTYPELFAEDQDGLTQAVASHTYELSSFLVRVLKVDDVGASWYGRLTWRRLSWLT
jgi:hypothetical protein